MTEERSIKKQSSLNECQYVFNEEDESLLKDSSSEDLVIYRPSLGIRIEVIILLAELIALFYILVSLRDFGVNGYKVMNTYNSIDVAVIRSVFYNNEVISQVLTIARSLITILYFKEVLHFLKNVN